MRNLNEIRKDINAVDGEIRELFLKRMALAEEVVTYKMCTGDRILKPEREKQILDTARNTVPPALQQEYLSFVKTAMRVSRKQQYETLLNQHPEKLTFPLFPRNHTPQTVVCQGIEGSYQSAAATELYPSAQLSHVTSFEDVFRAVSVGDAELGLIPVENSTAGTINEVYDLLVRYQLYIVHSHVQPIRHCLCACAGATLDSVTDVYSIRPALDQCRHYIARKQLKECEAGNTAMAAKLVYQKNDPTCAAICSEQAAALYGLSVLEHNISDDEYNQTRFIVISRQMSAEQQDNRVSILFTLPHESGSLAAALAVFADYECNLTEIHSRPLPEAPWNYRFYADFSGNVLEKNTRTLLFQLFEELPSARLLGCYTVTTTEECSVCS